MPAAEPDMPPNATQGLFLAALRRARVPAVLRFLVVALLLGWFYGWAEPRFYPKEKRVGFGYGMMHGALMPMALPALVMGRDVSIYHDYNTGRTYKLGYIVGINLCGLVFFGSVFWRPTRKAPVSADAHSSQVR
jgi:hypothetical protein